MHVTLNFTVMCPPFEEGLKSANIIATFLSFAALETAKIVFLHEQQVWLGLASDSRWKSQCSPVNAYNITFKCSMAGILLRYVNSNGMDFSS